jgi:hypothetical protein
MTQLQQSDSTLDRLHEAIYQHISRVQMTMIPSPGRYLQLVQVSVRNELVD